MKIIDLLNKIANGEEVPKEVEVGLNHYTYENNGEYYNTSDSCDLLFDFNDDYQLRTCLNQTVYPITYEEEKKIPEKLDYIHPDIQCSYNESELLLRIEANKDKINSIIDYLKSKGE